MEKIDLDVLRKTEGYQQYLKTLVGSNNECVGYNKKHSHPTPYGESGPAIGNNFFLHQHATEMGLLKEPYEFDPETLEHNHHLPIYEEKKIIKP